MRRRYFILFLFASLPLALYSQNNPKVGTPEVSFYSDTLKIVYSLSNCKEGDPVKIDLNIYYSDGSKVRASKLSGDIGENIRCGKNLTIYWDLAADNIQINDDIEIEILADRIIVDKPVEGRTQKTRQKTGRGKIIASSLIFPGLGQKKASGKKAHLILGIAGYGSAAAAGIMFSESDRAYNRYAESTTQQERDEYFQKSEDLFNMAKGAAIGAAGIWTLNLLWAAIIPIDNNNMTLGLAPVTGGGFTINASWNF